MKETRTWLLLFVAAVLFRVGHCLVLFNEIIPGSDQMQEILLGRKLSTGNFYGVLDTYWAPVYPTLIGIASFFVDSPTVPAIVVSVLANSLIVPLNYILVRQSYERREGLIAGVIALFFPHLVNSVIQLGSENVFVPLMLGVLIAAWKGIQKGSAMLFLVTGSLLGLAYLSRPEAIGYLIFFVLIILGYNQILRRSAGGRSVPQLAALGLGFFLLATPYLIFLKNETGRWTVSGKAAINTIASDLENDAPSDGHAADVVSFKAFTKYFFLNLVEAQKVFPVLFPLLLWSLIGLGLFSAAWDNERRDREIFLILFCLVTIAGYAAAVIQLRYFYVLLPILIGWSARGLVVFSELFRGPASRRTDDRSRLLGPTPVIVVSVAAIFLYVLPLNFYMRSNDALWETSGYEERDAGLWIRQHARSTPYVFSASRRPVFFAEARQLAPRSENIGDVLSAIRSEKVDYVVTSDRSLKRNPYLKGLDEILRTDATFEKVYDNNVRKGYGISIFKRISIAE